MNYFLIVCFLISGTARAAAYLPLQLLASGDMSSTVASLTAGLTSNGVDLQQFPLASIQFVWTGSPVGFIEIQRSNDIVAPSQGTNQAANVVNWTTDLTTSVGTSSYPEKSYLFNLPNAGYRWVRARYLPVSGTGSLGVRFLGKSAQ